MITSMDAPNPIRDSLGSIRSEIAKRLIDSGIAKLVDAHNALADVCGAEPLASLTGLAEAAAAKVLPAPPAVPKSAARPATPEGSGRISKWYAPVGKALLSGPKRVAELERALDVAGPSFLGPVLVKYPGLFKKNGQGRGSTWELTEAGRREFDQGKA